MSLTDDPDNPEESTGNPPTDNDYYEYINRSVIHLVPPESSLVRLELPVKRVIISHTATPICTDFVKKIEIIIKQSIKFKIYFFQYNCSARVLNIQSYHMKTSEFVDIGLNFLVGGDGRAYEGRGYYVGAHTKGFNNGSICIAFIGLFAEYEAPQRQILAAQRFIDDAVKDNKIDSHYVLYGQVQLNGFKSPGVHLFDVIKTWEHWSDKV